MVWMFGRVEGVAGEGIAVGFERGRPSLDGRIERLNDKNSVIAADVIGKPFELVEAPRRVQVEIRHHHQEQCRLFYFGIDAFGERIIPVERRIHPDRNATFLIFRPQEHIELTAEVIDQRLRPFADEIAAHAAEAGERLGAVRVADKYVVRKTRNVRHAEPLQRWNVTTR